MANHERWMQRALEEAEKALDCGEVPVGCVFVMDDVEIGCGYNKTNETLNPTHHAELVAIAAMKEGTDFKRCDLYVTCEPCIMCASALAQIGIRRIFFGCSNDKFGGCGSILTLHKDNCYQGYCKDQAVSLLQRFYARDNSRTAESSSGASLRRKRRRQTSPHTSSELTLVGHSNG